MSVSNERIASTNRIGLEGPVVAWSPDRATRPDRRSPEGPSSRERFLGDLRSAHVAWSGDQATTVWEREPMRESLARIEGFAAFYLDFTPYRLYS